MTTPVATDAEPQDYRRWFLRGIIGAASIPGLILMSAFVGFAGLAREAGLTVYQIWAVPAKVVLIGAIMSGASLPAAAFAVALSSIRLGPMVVALLPEMRTEQTRTWVLLLLSHFVAVTSWVLAMEQLRNVPREMRTVYYGGLGSALIITNMCVVAVVYAVAGSLSPAISAGLLLLTPIYFLTSLWGSARESASHFAMGFGLFLGPVLHVYAPGLDLMLAGLIGGTAAFAIHIMRKRRVGT
jgi:hypothetical protein